jgi:hypothetical protein
MSDQEVNVKTKSSDEKVRKDAANPNSHGVGTLVLNGDSGGQKVRIAYLPESLAYYNDTDPQK